MSSGQQFVMPDFYIGWPARLSPHVESARAHTMAWSREMGIFDSPSAGHPPVWDESMLEAMDFPLMMGYCYPDAPADVLALITDWYVWAFYFDDHLLEVYKRTGDLDGGHAHLKRLRLFMALDPDAAAPDPLDPVERALQDLWQRTAPTKSATWCKRFADTTLTATEESGWELDNIADARIPNPIECVLMRRVTGATLWAADIVEYANFIEIPERIWDARPVRVLREAFADGVWLRNDIFSYHREIDLEGELANFVLALEQFLGVGVQRAVDLTNDLLTSRLQQFEHTAATELPELCEEHGLDASERRSLRLYVQGLQDWQYGAHEWHLRSSRYTDDRSAGAAPAGSPVTLPGPPGHAATLSRLGRHSHIPYARVGPGQPTRFHMPFEARLNPHIEQALRYCMDWCQRMGMLDPVAAAGCEPLWSPEALAGFDLAGFAASVFPRAAADALNAAVRWTAWGTYADDWYPRVYGRSRDLAGAKACNARLALFMPLERDATPPPASPVEAGLADAWRRTAQAMTVADRRALRGGIESMLEAWLWELLNHVEHRLPDPVDYIEMRRETVGAGWYSSVVSDARAGRLPAELTASRPWLGLEHAAWDYTTLTNDVFSYQKEIEFEGELMNGVLVIEHFLGVEREEAAGIVRGLAKSRIEQFEYTVSNDLPILAERFELGEGGRALLDARVVALQDLMAGQLAWHARSARFDEQALRRRYAPAPVDDLIPRLRLGGPTGLGTAAARLAPLSHGTPANGGLSPETPRAGAPAHAAGPRRRPGTVAVFGGGIAGLTAAHELAERGFEVTVHERRAWGGRARSTEVAGSAGPGRRPLPGEHGYRITSGYYQNLPDTMRRIPFGSNPNGVLDNLVALSELRFAREGRRDLVLPLQPPKVYPTTPQQLIDRLRGALTSVDVSPRAVAHFVHRMVVFLSSCDARRSGQWEPMSWAEFSGLDDFSDDYRRILGVASWTFSPEPPERTSAKHTAWKLEIASHCWPGHGASGPARRVLDAPTNDAWIDPWLALLAPFGARLNLGHEVVRLQLDEGRVAGAHMHTPRGAASITADWYVCALPLDRARRVLRGPILAADHRLSGLGELGTGWGVGIQFYLDEPTHLCDGAGICGDSPWIIAYLEYAQLWSLDIARSFGDGRVRQIITCIVANWETPGVVYRKAAQACTLSEVAREVWEQLKSHANKSWERPKLTDEMLVSWSIDEGLTEHDGRLDLEDPFVLATAGTERYRPGVTTAIPNLMLAGDYLAGEWEVGTMEAACFNGRRAANAILERAGSAEPPAAATGPFRPPEWEPLKQIDVLRYARGEPNLFDVDGTLPRDCRRLLDWAPPGAPLPV